MGCKGKARPTPSDGGIWWGGIVARKRRVDLFTCSFDLMRSHMRVGSELIAKVVCDADAVSEGDLVFVIGKEAREPGLLRLSDVKLRVLA